MASRRRRPKKLFAAYLPREITEPMVKTELGGSKASSAQIKSVYAELRRSAQKVFPNHWVHAAPDSKRCPFPSSTGVAVSSLRSRRSAWRRASMRTFAAALREKCLPGATSCQHQLGLCSARPILRDRRHVGRHAAPVFTHAATNAPACCDVPRADCRPEPGAQVYHRPILQASPGGRVLEVSKRDGCSRS